MSECSKKRIVLGVTGSIAAYKSCDIIRELGRKGYDIRVVMSNDASRFVSAATFAALSHHPVAVDLFSSQPYGPIPHCDIAKDMDLLLVAPVTAQSIAKFAHGFADNLLSALFLVTDSPVILAPAMNPHMYLHPFVQSNIETLKRAGVEIIEPVDAQVACGEKGIGHLASVESICERVEYILGRQDSLKGRSFLITAGPTREFIDPVRFISNRSSGKMGFALAQAAKKRGAEVFLIAGPSSLPDPLGITCIRAITANEMLSEVEKVFPRVDVIIMVAAICDFTPKTFYSKKIKKEQGPPLILLDKTPDILSLLGRKKGREQILVGFAAEDQDITENAEIKLKQKNLDLVIANDISKPDSGFESDKNQVTLIYRSGVKKVLALEEKGLVAERILDAINVFFD